VDALTRLGSRQRFEQILRCEWRRAVLHQTALSLVMLHLDGLGHFNDLCGHLTGDHFLHTVAGVLASIAAEAGGSVARYGGGEFALILPATNASDAGKIAQGAWAAVAALGSTHAGNLPPGGVVTVSLGLATEYPRSGATETPWLELIAEARARLYEARRTGQNRIVLPASIAGAPLAPNEEARLVALAAYERAEATGRGRDFDRIARLAAKMTSTPIGLVSLVGDRNSTSPGNQGCRG
jgi:diguanylate cyclase (GGDEF)-like protein